MMAFPEFYKKHMNICIAFAPVATLDHQSNKVLTKLSDKEQLVKMFKSQCPWILNQPGAFNQAIQNLHAVSGLTQTLSLKLSIEERPELCSKQAIINYGGHFPAGGSFKQLEHYR